MPKQQKWKGCQRRGFRQFLEEQTHGIPTRLCTGTRAMPVENEGTDFRRTGQEAGAVNVTCQCNLVPDSGGTQLSLRSGSLQGLESYLQHRCEGSQIATDDEITSFHGFGFGDREAGRYSAFRPRRQEKQQQQKPQG